METAALITSAALPNVATGCFGGRILAQARHGAPSRPTGMTHRTPAAVAMEALRQIAYAAWEPCHAFSPTGSIPVSRTSIIAVQSMYLGLLYKPSWKIRGTLGQAA